MVDMSDNANKFGTDIGSIQNAYQGFAKQNYTMLDNLKLGYGGTKEEMQRLISDASKMTDVMDELGVSVDADDLSFGNIVNAISVMQKSLDISGTTAKEAATTFSGSFGAMKAAGQDFLASLTGVTDEAGNKVLQVSDTMSNLVQAASTFVFGSLLPMLGNIVISLPEALITGITQAVPAILTNLGTMFSSMSAYIAAKVPTLGTDISQSVVSAVNSIADQLPQFVTQGATVIYGIADGIITNAPVLFSQIQTLAYNMISNFMENFPKFLQAGAELVVHLVNGITMSLPTVVEDMSLVAITMLDTFISHLPEFLQQGAETINKMIDGIVANIPSMTETFNSLLDTVISAIMTYLPEFLNQGVQFIFQIAQGIIKNLPTILSAMISTIISVIASIASNLPQFLAKGGEIIGNIMAGICGMVPSLLGSIPGILVSAASEFGKYDWVSIGKNIVSGIISGIGNMAGALVNKMKSLASSALNAAKSFLGIHSPSKAFEDEVGEMIPRGTANGVEDDKSLMKAINTMADDAINQATLSLGDLNSAIGLTAKATPHNGANTTNNSTVFNQTINSAKALTPSEIAQETKNMMRRMAWA